MLLFDMYEKEEEEVETQTEERKKNANLYGFSRQQPIQK